MRRIIVNAGMLCDVAGNGVEAGAYTRPPINLSRSFTVRLTPTSASNKGA
jgi:hypothetical protein